LTSSRTSLLTSLLPSPLTFCVVVVGAIAVVDVVVDVYVPLMSLRMPSHAYLILLETSVTSLDVPSCSLDICLFSIDVSSRSLHAPLIARHVSFMCPRCGRHVSVKPYYRLWFRPTCLVRGNGAPPIYNVYMADFILSPQ
jgi:hypothetical protein